MVIDIFSLLCGISIGIIVCIIVSILNCAGYLRIDRTDPDKDFYLLDITKDLDKIPKKKRINLKIDTKYKKTH